MAKSARALQQRHLKPYRSLVEITRTDHSKLNGTSLQQRPLETMASHYNGALLELPGARQPKPGKQRRLRDRAERAKMAHDYSSNHSEL